MPDPWLGVDKQRHAGLSAIAVFVGFVVLLVARNLTPVQLLGVAAAVVAGLGILKEVADRALSLGHASGRDLVANAVGIIVGAAAAWLFWTIARIGT